MLALNLYWKRNGEDIALGTGYHPAIPPIGGLLVFVTDHGSVWRVTSHLQHLVMEGSMAHRAAQQGRQVDLAGVVLFVEPDTGPFEH